jgi:hypothetical protein
MADDTTKIDATTQKIAETVKKVNDAMADSADLASKMVDIFKKLNVEMGKNQNALKLSNSFNKQILSDTKARAMIQSQMSSDIEDSQKNIVKAKKEALNKEIENIDLQKELLKLELDLQDVKKRGEVVNLDTLSKNSKKYEEIKAKIANNNGLAKKAIEDAESELKVRQDLLKNIRLQSSFMAHMEDSNYAALGPFSDIVIKAKQFSENIKVIPLRFMLLNTLIKVGIDRFVALDKAAEDFRKQTGFSNTQMIELRKNVESINREFQDIGVGVDQAYASAKALTDVFGRTSLVSREAMQNVSLMSVNLGVAAEDSANVLATFQGLGKASQEAAMNVMKVGAGLSEKAGIPFSLVMKDIANASEQTTAMLGANPSKLMKSAIAARALGTDMNKIVSSQRKLLDFSSSINEELELSALLGRNISFQKARQLAYDGDIAGAAKATLDAVNKAGNFNEMNVYQREALAKASGMELKDLTKMIAVDQQRNAILSGNDQAAKDKLLAQEETLKALERENDLSKQSLVDQNESAIRQQKMQGQMMQLKNIMESIMVSVGDILEPIIRIASFVLVPAFKIVAALIRGMLKPILNIGQALMGNADNAQKFATFAEKVSIAMIGVYNFSEKIGESISKILIPISGVFGFIEKLTGTAGRFSDITRNIAAWFLKGARYVETFASGLSGVFKVFKPFASIIGSVLKGFASFAKFLGPIGLIVTAIQFVVSLWTRFSNLFSSDEFVKADWPKKLVLGLKAIGGALYDVLLQPFVDVYQWIKKRLMGNSPSEIGLGIVDGIKAVGGMLLDVIISPFKAGFEFVTSAFSYVVNSIKNIASDIFGFITSPFKKAMEFVKSIPLFGNLFGGNNIGAAAKFQADNSITETSGIIEVKNLDVLRDVVQELTNAVANLATTAPAAAGATAAMNTSGVEAKLDTLTNLLTGGAVRVYLDGKDVSAAMTGIGR